MAGGHRLSDGGLTHLTPEEWRDAETVLAEADNGLLAGEPRVPGPAITASEVLGPYRIEKKLAEGGMGEIYQAFDDRLERRVAIKVLPARLSRDASALMRFECETKALAALSHPNILTIFDVGRHGGTAFAVTELLTGATLRQRLRRGKMPVSIAVEVAAQVARGLAITLEALAEATASSIPWACHGRPRPDRAPALAGWAILN